MKEIEIYIKGSYVPRDEKMCINVLIKSSKNEVARYFEIKEKGSAIEAEYIGLLKVMNLIRTKLSKTKKHLTTVKIFSINEVIVKQLTGEYRVSNSRLLSLYSELKKVLNGLNYKSILISKSEMNEKMKPQSKIYDEKQLKDLLNRIDFDEEDIWVGGINE